MIKGKLIKINSNKVENIFEIINDKSESGRHSEIFFSSVHKFIVNNGMIKTEIKGIRELINVKFLKRKANTTFNKRQM